MAKRKTPDPARVAEMLTGRQSISPDELFELGVIPCSRGSIYKGCKTGEIECFQVGKKIFIPTAPLRRKLGHSV